MNVLLAMSVSLLMLFPTKTAPPRVRAVQFSNVLFNSCSTSGRVTLQTTLNNSTYLTPRLKGAPLIRTDGVSEVGGLQHKHPCCTSAAYCPSYAVDAFRLLQVCRQQRSWCGRGGGSGGVLVVPVKREEVM